MDPFTDALRRLDLTPAFRQGESSERLRATLHKLDEAGMDFDIAKKPAEAEICFWRAVLLAEQGLGATHETTITSLNRLALFYSHQHKSVEATAISALASSRRRKQFHTSIEIMMLEGLHRYEEEYGPVDPRTGRQFLQLIELYCDLGKYAEAEALLQRSLALHEEQEESESTSRLFALNRLGTFYEQQGEYARAEAIFLQAVQGWEQKLGPDDHQLAGPLNNLANIYEQRGKYHEAEALYRRAQRFWELDSGPESLPMAMSLNGLAIVYRKQGRYPEAEQLTLRALSLYARNQMAEQSESARLSSNLADIYREQGRYLEAEALYQQAMVLCEQQGNIAIALMISPLQGLARAYREQGRENEARQLFTRALFLSNTMLGREHPQTRAILEAFTDPAVLAVNNNPAYLVPILVFADQTTP